MILYQLLLFVHYYIAKKSQVVRYLLRYLPYEKLHDNEWNLHPIK